MTGQANLLQALGWAVLNSLWQLAFLWVIYQILTSLFRLAKPAAKSVLATGLLMAGFGWFIITFLSSLSSADNSEILYTGFVASSSDYQLNEWLGKMLPIASIIYLVLLFVPVLQFIRNYRYVQVIRRYGLSKMDVEWRMFVNKVATRMGINKPIQIWISELVSSPVTIGYLKPVILVPLAAINHLTPQQLEAVLLHELSHIRRYDYLVNILINFIKTVLYFNPFAKAFVSIVEKERERSCDDMVLQFQYNSYEYASALLTLEKSSHLQKTFTLGITGKKNDLLQRVELIMGIEKKPVISFNRLTGLFAGLLCVIALNALLIMSKPLNEKPGGFAHLSTPYSFFTAGLSNLSRKADIKEITAPTVSNHLIAKKEISKPVPKTTEPATVYKSYYPAGYVPANFEAEIEVPVLKDYQERQVIAAVDASRKVMENARWKAVEKSVADVFTRKEKEQLKTSYEKELSKINWKQLENDLRIAYNNVDWEKVNNQLYHAMSQVQIDSLHRVYNDAFSQLSLVEKELKAYELAGIPDTDISLKAVENSRRETVKALNKVKALRSKKIVHL